jgi:hypothetical protein
MKVTLKNLFKRISSAFKPKGAVLSENHPSAHTAAETPHYFPDKRTEEEKQREQQELFAQMNADISARIHAQERNWSSTYPLGDYCMCGHTKEEHNSEGVCTVEGCNCVHYGE